MVEPPTKGQPPNNGQNFCPQVVHYSEVPLYSMSHFISGLNRRSFLDVRYVRMEILIVTFHQIISDSPAGVVLSQNQTQKIERVKQFLVLIQHSYESSL